MCKSIEYLHSKEICHLDLKLSNFVRNSEGTIKLLDFGHACSSKNPIKSVRGTSEYNSHERQLRNYDGKKADIFSLGICLTALMVGKVPCSRNKEAFPNTFTFKTRPEAFWVGLEALTKKSHPDFPGLDSEAVKLIEEMVSQEPSNRPAIETVFSHSFFS
jgi:serine/threonine protein kinase